MYWISIGTEVFIYLHITFCGNVMSPSSSWLNFVQMDGEVMCSSKCVRYVGQFKGVWPVGHLFMYVCM